MGSRTRTTRLSFPGLYSRDAIAWQDLALREVPQLTAVPARRVYRQERAMPVIRHPNEIYTVIVTLDAEADVIPELEAHARSGLELFRDFAGFLGGALHKSADGSRLIQYVQWETESHYLACTNDPRWDAFPSAQQFMAIVEAGRARMDVRAYKVLAAVDGPPGADART